MHVLELVLVVTCLARYDDRKNNIELQYVNIGMFPI